MKPLLLLICTALAARGQAFSIADQAFMSGAYAARPAAPYWIPGTATANWLGRTAEANGSGDLAYFLNVADYASVTNIQWTSSEVSEIGNLHGLIPDLAGLRLDYCNALSYLDMSGILWMRGGFTLHDVTNASTSLNLADLNGVRYFHIHKISGLAEFNAPSLESGTIYIYDCTNLTSVALGRWKPLENTWVYFINDALDNTSVNHVLERCVESGCSNLYIVLNGGSTASPTGQGVADAYTLEARGNLVELNW